HPRFEAGAVGYLAYDQVRHFENLPPRTADDLGLPEARFLFSDCVTIFDNLSHTVKVVAVAAAGGPAAQAYRDACARIEQEIERLRGPLPEEPGAMHAAPVRFESNVGQAAFERAVERA